VLLESGFTGFSGASCPNYIDAQLKMAIDEEIIPGPRIRACGNHIGTTGDMNNGGRWWKAYQTPGTDVCADGPDALRALVRQEIDRGAETIKIFASAGHGQPNRTVRNMSREEIAAIINTAHERGAKVRAHVADKAMIMECGQIDDSQPKTSSVGAATIAFTQRKSCAPRFRHGAPTTSTKS
jgi:imidazolonepropionase-like amidohydrolase